MEERGDQRKYIVIKKYFTPHSYIVNKMETIYNTYI